MNSQSVSPFSGSPRTIETTDKAGFPQFRVVSHELTPFGAKAADMTAQGIGLIAGGWSIIELLKPAHPVPADFIAVPIIYAVSRLGTRVILREEFEVKTVFNLSIDRIKVRKGLRTRSFDRNIEHRFLLVPHDYAREEQARNELAVRQAQSRGTAIRKPVYYGESAHIALEYGGQIFILCTVYGLARAEAILRRLRYCLECLDKAAKIGGKGKQDRSADWPPAPGGLGDV